jgi:hypothetical protein
MKLGSKGKDVDHFVDKLRSEGTGITGSIMFSDPSPIATLFQPFSRPTANQRKRSQLLLLIVFDLSAQNRFKGSERKVYPSIFRSRFHCFW